MDIDDIRDYVVCLNGGSGILFQPEEEKYTYVLTAKHVFDDIDSELYNGKVMIQYYSSKENKYDLIKEFELKLNENYFPHSQDGVDASILKIQKIPNKGNIIVKENFASDNKDYILAGYPAIRRKEAEINLDSIRYDLNITILQQKEGQRREADVSKNQTLEELVGSSGGGVIKIFGDYLSLVGIQSRMANGEESLGRIEFTPIEVFNQIASASNGLIELIWPYYMKCFSFLKDDVFKLEVEEFDEQKIDFTRSYLKNKAQDVIKSGVTPIGIKTLFEKRLLVNEFENEELYTREIWRMWLEFLTVMNIIKYSEFNKEELNEIFNSFRLIFSNSQADWISLHKDLLYSDYKGLKPGSNVFIGTSRPPIKNFILPKDRIRDISRVYDKQKIKTDSDLHPFTHFNFIHLDYLKQKCILDKLEQYASINDEGELLTALKKEYNELFR